MLGLAVGIDYALFILSRHRQGLHEGLRPRESTAQSIATAGSAVVFAGMTVIIALVGLLVVDIPFLTVMGLAAAGTVAIAVAHRHHPRSRRCSASSASGSAARNRVLGYNARRRDPASAETLGTRWARLVTRRPLLFVLGGARAHAHHRHPGDAHEARPARTTARSRPARPSARRTTC